MPKTETRPACTGSTSSPPAAAAILSALRHPFFVIAADDSIVEANDAAETFFHIGRLAMKRRKISDLLPFGSPLANLIAQVRQRGTPVNEYAVELAAPGRDGSKPVDLQVTPLTDMPGQVLVVIFERAMANKIDRQLFHRGAAKSVVGLASMLGHEIKNPLSGIRGAAQLLALDAGPDDRQLTQLICDETDRICRLIDRMEVFSDDRPLDGKPVNIHAVLDRVEQIATRGIARDIRFVTDYDPSLPLVLGDQDQLIQAFLNLVINAAEALIVANGPYPVIHLKSSFQPGIRLKVPGGAKMANLPLLFVVSDNGPGVSPDMVPHLFDPFITSKTNGSGLGLSLVAKIIRDHGGVVEYVATEQGSTFRVLLPMQTTVPKLEKPGSQEKN